jgi:uncharacterized protein (TIGR04255 family)
MNLENLHPISNDHAVQSVHLVVEWGSALSSDSVLALGKLLSKFRNLGYGHMTPQSMMRFKIDGNVSTQETPLLGGYLFTQLALPQVSRQLGVTAENCTIMFPDYTRWDSVFDSFQGVLKIVLDEVGASRPVRSIGLQYVDVFQWNDDPDELDLRQVFKNDFVVPPHVFEQKGLWHLHHGYFEKFQEPLPHTVLQNINVDMVETGSTRALQIVGSHKANLHEPLWQAHKKNKDQFLEMISHLHNVNKSVLTKLLTTKLCERINLKA